MGFHLFRPGKVADDLDLPVWNGDGEGDPDSRDRDAKRGKASGGGLKDFRHETFLRAKSAFKSLPNVESKDHPDSWIYHESSA